jgi:hypothetical protein
MQAAAGLDKRVTNPLQVVNLPHAGGRDRHYILRSSIVLGLWKLGFKLRYPLL